MDDAVTINVAVPGYSSYQGLVMLRRMLEKFRFDAVVVSFNFNDRRYVLNAEDVDGPESFQRTYDLSRRQRWMSILEKSYIVRAVSSVLRKTGIIAEEKPTPVHVESLLPRVSPDMYRKNLTAMATLAREHHAALLFLLLQDSPVQTCFLRAGIAQLMEAHPDSAIEYLKIAQRNGAPFTTLARAYLSNAYKRLGKADDAQNVSIIPHPQRSLQGGYPVRLDSEYNEIMREVGKTVQVGVVDGAEELRKHLSVYYDFGHFDARGSRMIAELLASRLRDILQSSR